MVGRARRVDPLVVEGWRDESMRRIDGRPWRRLGGVKGVRAPALCSEVIEEEGDGEARKRMGAEDVEGESEEGM